jgi:hypothetical protein
MSRDLWIKVARDLKRHPKTRRAARLLGVGRAQVIGHLACLWSWAMDFAESGDISPFDPEEVEEEALWEGEPGKLIEALLECGVAGGPGFLERSDEGGLLIHDYGEWIEGLIETRKRNRDRQKRWRERKAKEREAEELFGERSPSKNNGVVTPSVTVMSPLRNVSHNALREEKTREDKRREDLSIVPSPSVEGTEPEPSPSPPDKKAPRTFFPSLWKTITDDQGYSPTWSYDIETKAVKVILREFPNVTPDELSRFLSYKRTCYGVDPNSQPSFSRYKGDFGPWYLGGMPEKQEGARNGQGDRAVPGSRNGGMGSSRDEQIARSIAAKMGRRADRQSGDDHHEGAAERGSGSSGGSGISQSAGGMGRGPGGYPSR